MIQERAVDDFIERYQNKKQKGLDDEEDMIEDKIEKLKKYLLDSQNLIQQTIDTVEENTQAASLSNIPSDEIINYALRNESYWYCPNIYEVENSYLYKINSRSYQKAQEPRVKAGGQPLQNEDRILQIDMGMAMNKDLQIQGCNDEGVYVTTDKQMPNICIHDRKELFSENYQNKSSSLIGGTQEVRYVAFKNGMMESELGVAIVDLTNQRMGHQVDNNTMIIETISVAMNHQASSSVDWGYSN